MAIKIQFSRATIVPAQQMRDQQVEDKICKQLEALKTPLQKANLKEREISLIERRYKERLALASAVPNSKRIREAAREVRTLIRKARFEEMMAKFEIENRSENIAVVLRSAEPSRAVLEGAHDFQSDFEHNPKLSFAFKENLVSEGRYSTDGEIELTASLSFKKKVAYALFELTNAIQGSDMAALYEKANRKELTPTEFATQIELCEYQGVKFFSETMEILVQDHGWDPEMDVYANLLAGPWKTFDGYLVDQIATGHFQEYVKACSELQKIERKSSL